MTWELSLTGLLIGLLVGITGMGGGSLMTPILILFFGFKPTLAVGTDILHGAVFKSFGAVRHRRLGTVHARMTFWMFLASGPMSLAGVQTAEWLESQYGDSVESASAKVIGAALILGGLGFLAKTFVNRGVQPDDAPFLLRNRDRVICFVLGAVGGYIVGLTSVGSGTFFALVMLLVFPLTAANLVGSRLTVRLPERSLRVALATVLLASGLRLLEVPAYDILVPVVLATGAVVAAVVEFKRLNGRVAQTDPV